MLRFNVKCLLILSILCYLTRPVLSDCRNAFVPGFDYFPNKVYFEGNLESNPDFNVAYYESYIIVTNNVDTFTETYVLYCTAEMPTLTNVPIDSTNYIQIPVTNVAVSDRAIISFLEILGEEGSIKYVGDKSAITSPCLQQNNNLYENLNFANTTQLASADVIFTHTPQKGGKYVQVSFNEDTPALRKAEWIKFVSLFFNKTEVANEIFGKIQSNYLCHLDNVSNIPKEKRKTIAWVSLESDFTFTVKYHSFYQNITTDAAGFILIPQITNVPTTDELHQSIDDAYIVIDMSDLTAPHNTLDAWKYYFGYNNVSTLPRFLKEKRLYRTHKLLNNNGYDDWTESSGPRPDLVLQDLIAMQFPLYQPDYNVRWFDKFAETGDNVIISGEQCVISTFGNPKTDFGTCAPFKFNGKNNNGHKNNKNNKNNEKEKKVKAGVIIGVSVTGSLILLGLGAWLLVVARRKYRERFVKLRDEPVVQMNSVKEVQLDSVKEVK